MKIEASQSNKLEARTHHVHPDVRGQDLIFLIL